LKEVSLSDNACFEIFIGRRVLKEEIFQSRGKIPIYSANVHQPFGFLDRSNIDDFTHDYILWGIDGDFEFNVISKGEKFATTDHCGAIKLLDSQILPEYVLYQLETKKHEFGFDRTLRASLSNMRKFAIDIPVTRNGEFDEKMQRAIVKKYMFLKERRGELENQIRELKEAKMEIEREVDCRRVKLSDIFDFPPTNTGMTKAFCEKNKGEIPVYGCSKSEEHVLGHIKANLPSIRYYRNCLTWNRNGSVGYVFYRRGTFSTNEDHRVMEAKDAFSELLYPFYFKYILQNAILKLGYGFTNKLGKSKMKKIEVDVPAREDGSFDLQAQTNIATAYKEAYLIKTEMIENLETLNTISVTVN
jgi:restriction endonuclease S subunit